MPDRSNRPVPNESPFQPHWLDSTYSIKTSLYSSQIKRIVDAALAAVDPYQAVRRAAYIDTSHLVIAGEDYDLETFHRVVMVAVGKAAYSMALAAEDILGDWLDSGLVVTKESYVPSASQPERSQLRRSQVFLSGHPIPDRRGIAAAQEIMRLLESLSANDLVIFLISGGGSALLNFPVPGVSLADLQDLTQILLRSGATVNQLNTLRKHLDTVKGGGLARLAAPATMATLLLSDVIGNPMDAIASGLTVPDYSTFKDAWSILEEYNLITEIPVSIRLHLEKGLRGELPETLKPGDPVFDRTQPELIASNYQAASAAVNQARANGMNALLLTSFLQGEAREVGRMLGALARQVLATGEPVLPPACIIAGGETTVTVRGDGLGGRNQEVALGSILELAGLSYVVMVALATDGGDGPTDAAGAVVTGESLDRALKLGLEPGKFLQRNDAYSFFDKLGDLLRSGPTGTNVNDLTFLLAF